MFEKSRKLLKIEEGNKISKNMKIERKFCEVPPEEEDIESDFASLVIPKIETHHMLQPNPSKSKNAFLTWSSVTSAAPSPPVENVSTIQHDAKARYSGETNPLKSSTIECDFTHIDEENYNHEDIVLLERFKEAIELLIIKVNKILLN
jgi:hypothetical protein